MSDPPDDLAGRDRQKIRDWMRAKNRDGIFPKRFLNERFLRGEIEDMLLWHRANGKRKVCWRSTAQMWIRRTIARELDGGMGTAYRAREYPQEARAAGRRQMELLADVIELHSPKRKAN